MTLHVVATDLTRPLLSDLSAAYAEVAPNIFLASTLAPAAILSADLAAGRADLALVVAPDPALFATPIAYLSLSVVVHPDNQLAALTPAQVQEIFVGRVNDWSQVGGPSGQIQVVSREETSDAAVAFRTEALRGAAPTRGALVAPTWAAMREAVGQNPNAVGYLPAPELDGSVKRMEVGTAPRVLIVAVSLSEPTGPAREFLAWAQSEAGQRVVARRYDPLASPPSPVPSPLSWADGPGEGGGVAVRPRRGVRSPPHFLPQRLAPPLTFGVQRHARLEFL